MIRSLFFIGAFNYLEQFYTFDYNYEIQRSMGIVLG